MTETEIKQMLAQGERLTLECKKAKTELPKSVWESYSAFANTIGGYILLGIDENRKETDVAKRFTIIGVDNIPKLISDLWNTINSNKVNRNILLDSDVEVNTIDGKSIICIHVPQADWRMKPVFLNENPYKGSFKRNHEGDYHCTEMEVRAMIRDANEDGNDGGLLDGFTLDDIDTNTLHSYRNQFRILNADHEWNDKDDKEFLRLLGGYTKNRQTGKEGLTVAGLMMFGTGLAIRERFGNFRMDYLDMSHLEGEERYRDRLTYDGRWENNLYQFFRIVMPKLTFDLPHPFHMEGYQRVDDTPQMKAVREGFTNSIIHSDLFLDSGILRIEKHDDCLCLRNPGNLKLPIENIYEGGVSKARNPRIQNMLRMIGYGENIGSGFPKIISAWQKAGWGKPELIDKYELQEVELRLPIPNETGGQTGGQTGLPKTIEKVFESIKDNPYITRQELVDKIGIKASAIQKHIEKLKAQKRIERVGSSTFGGHWEIKEQIILRFIIETTIFNRRLSIPGVAYFFLYHPPYIFPKKLGSYEEKSYLCQRIAILRPRPYKA